MTIRTLLPLLVLLAGCELVLALTPGGVPIETMRSCEETLELEGRVVVGHVIDGVFEPLSDGTPVFVHAGSQGGFHSDLVIRLEGPGADAEGGGGIVTMFADVDPGGWTEESNSQIHAWCQDLGEPGYYHSARLYWSGAGDEWDDDSMSWWELASQVFSLDVEITSDAFEGTDGALDVSMRQGEMEEDELGG
ncbi:MAG: hypothetical protein GY898_03955 [Proteobacteria bacterium]|nr:hypothetical protein [Pseudomonadota bacterium]